MQMECISSLTLKSHKALCLSSLRGVSRAPEDSQGLGLLAERPSESLFEASHLAEGLKENSGISHNR